MPVSNELVLFYYPGPAPEAAKARAVFARMGVRIKTITPDLLGESLGYLAGLAGFGPGGQSAQEPAPPDPILVLCNFAGHRLDALLQGLRKAGVPRTVYKAVLTPSNAPWTLPALARELADERAALEGGSDKERR